MEVRYLISSVPPLICRLCCDCGDQFFNVASYQSVLGCPQGSEPSAYNWISAGEKGAVSTDPSARVYVPVSFNAAWAADHSPTGNLKTSNSLRNSAYCTASASLGTTVGCENAWL